MHELTADDREIIDGMRALLDRWDRRRVFIVANLVRALLIAACAGVLASGAGESAIFIVALAVGGAGRFVASGLSAALPHVVDRPQLVAINSLTTTLGAGATAVGASTAVGLRAIFGSDDAGGAGVLADRADELLTRYGTRASEVIAAITTGPDAPLPEGAIPGARTLREAREDAAHRAATDGDPATVDR